MYCILPDCGLSRSHRIADRGARRPRFGANLAKAISTVGAQFSIVTTPAASPGLGYVQMAGVSAAGHRRHELPTRPRQSVVATGRRQLRPPWVTACGLAMTAGQPGARRNRWRRFGERLACTGRPTRCHRRLRQAIAPHRDDLHPSKHDNFVVSLTESATGAAQAQSH
jgi:hypothetical protein